MGKVLKNYIINREHHQFRKDFPEYENLSETYKNLELNRIKHSQEILESEKNQLVNADYTVYYNPVKPITYLIFYYIGAGIFAVLALTLANLSSIS